MTRLSDTIAHLSALQAAYGMAPSRADDHLSELPEFGSNPGDLAARVHLPADLAEHAALVVVLHGCTQTAAEYDVGSGWSGLADDHGFVLLFPEQRRANNPNLCFNWFSAEDARRDRGEAHSIRQMIDALANEHAIDPKRIFITGLSAGGAMASAMLASYPEVFKGGAIIAGLPYGSADSVPQALHRMRGQGVPDDETLTALVRDASGHDGPWPTISIWHGSSDATVSPSNADAILGQWRTLHGLGAEPTRIETLDGHPRRVWCDSRGRELIEAYTIAGMAHGTPLATTGEDGCGAAGAYMLEANISSTRRIAAFWGLTGPVESGSARSKAKAPRNRARSRPVQTTAAACSPSTASQSPPKRPTFAALPNVEAIIDDALRAAGLRR